MVQLGSYLGQFGYGLLSMHFSFRTAKLVRNGYGTIALNALSMTASGGSGWTLLFGRLSANNEASIVTLP